MTTSDLSTLSAQCASLMERMERLDAEHEACKAHYMEAATESVLYRQTLGSAAEQLNSDVTKVLKTCNWLVDSNTSALKALSQAEAVIKHNWLINVVKVFFHV